MASDDIAQQKSNVQLILAGYLFVILPCALLLLVSTAAFWMLYSEDPITLMYAVGGLLLAWVWYLFAAPRWRLYALRRVKNYREFRNHTFNLSLFKHPDRFTERLEFKGRYLRCREYGWTTMHMLNELSAYIDVEADVMLDFELNQLSSTLELAVSRVCHCVQNEEFDEHAAQTINTAVLMFTQCKDRLEDLVETVPFYDEGKELQRMARYLKANCS